MVVNLFRNAHREIQSAFLNSDQTMRLRQFQWSEKIWYRVLPWHWRSMNRPPTVVAELTTREVESRTPESYDF